MNNLALLIPRDSLHFDIDFEFSNKENKTANQIVYEHFLLYIKQLKINEIKREEKNKKINVKPIILNENVL